MNKKENPEDVKMVHVGFRMTEKELNDLDVFAVRMKLTRSDLLRNLISTGLDDLKLAQVFGLISMISFIRKHEITPLEIVELATQKMQAQGV